jgi:hypothetical protein
VRRWWPVAAVLVLQLGALAILPLRSASAIASGREITLRTRAYDPFDLLAGPYILLSYEVEETRRQGPNLDLPEDAPVYILVERAEPAWLGIGFAPVHGEGTRDRLWLRATWHAGRPMLDQARRLYGNEEQCREADELLRKAPDEGLVDLAVDEDGNVSPRRLHIAGRTFGN